MTRSKFDALLAVLCGFAAASVGTLGAGSLALAAHDDGVVRTAGAGFTGILGGLDLVVAAPALLLPFGTRAFRAGVASAVLAGIAAALAFELARALVSVVTPIVLRKVGPKASPISPRLCSAVAAVAVLTAVLAPSFQVEASSPGGAVLGAVLLLAVVHRAAIGDGIRAPIVAFALGLAASSDPTLAVVLVGALSPWLLDVARAAPRTAAGLAQVVVAFVLGLLPLGLALAVRARAPELTLWHVARETATAGRGALLGFALGEIGVLLLAAAALGIALAALVPAARRLVVSLVLVVLLGAATFAFDAPTPNRVPAAVLAAFVALHVLGASTLGVVVLAIARTRLPLAEVSASLVVILELVLPVRAFDETTVRRDGRAAHASAMWTDAAWGDAPPASVLVVSDRRTMTRIVSARAQGHLRGDLVVVPAFDVQGRAGQVALLAEPKLAPLYRDLALGLPPEELSLSQLGAQRPVLATFDPKWDRALSRHLVPVGLTSRFEPEPRGASDRKRALDAFAPARDRLLRASVARRDAELAAQSALLLRARAIALAATGERENLSQALDDLRQFAPDDGVHATLVRRLLTNKGAIDVRDLAP